MNGEDERIKTSSSHTHTFQRQRSALHRLVAWGLGDRDGTVVFIVEGNGVRDQVNMHRSVHCDGGGPVVIHIVSTLVWTTTKTTALLSGKVLVLLTYILSRIEWMKARSEKQCQLKYRGDRIRSLRVQPWKGLYRK